jgi:hypothetical protein
MSEPVPNRAHDPKRKVDFSPTCQSCGNKLTSHEVDKNEDFGHHPEDELFFSRANAGGDVCDKCHEGFTNSGANEDLWHEYNGSSPRGRYLDEDSYSDDSHGDNYPDWKETESEYRRRPEGY